MNIFTFQEPAKDRYGYGKMEIDEVLEIKNIMAEGGAAKIRCNIHAYGQYHNKKFKTKTVDGSLFIKRIK